MIFPHLTRLEHCLFQYSNVEAFESRQYDGSLTIDALQQYGDFGLGSFNALDGEIIYYEGKYYHATSDGNVCEASADSLISGAYSCFFTPQFQGKIDEEIDYSNCHEYITNKCGIQQQPFYAIRLDGFFSKIHVRSVPTQTLPYPSLDEVVEKQKVFDFTDMAASMVGFYFPPSMSGLAFQGLHLHFVSNDLLHGGHVLDFEMANGSYAVDQLEYFFHVLPDYVRNQISVSTPSI